MEAGQPAPSARRPLPRASPPLGARPPRVVRPRACRGVRPRDLPEVRESPPPLRGVRPRSGKLSGGRSELARGRGTRHRGAHARHRGRAADASLGESDHRHRGHAHRDQACREPPPPEAGCALAPRGVRRPNPEPPRPPAGERATRSRPGPRASARPSRGRRRRGCRERRPGTLPRGGLDRAVHRGCALAPEVIRRGNAALRVTGILRVVSRLEIRGISGLPRTGARAHRNEFLRRSQPVPRETDDVLRPVPACTVRGLPIIRFHGFAEPFRSGGVLRRPPRRVV